MSTTTERKGDYILTFTGRHFWPLDPRSEEVDIRDIAHSLALQCRFTGHTREFYSVAEHSVRVSLELPQEYALLGLLHDASETYLTDLPKPLKRCPEFSEYEQIEWDLLDCIFATFGLDIEDPALRPGFQKADAILLATEFRDLMPAGGTDRSLVGVEPLPDRIIPWAWDMAELQFLQRFEELTR